MHYKFLCPSNCYAVEMIILILNVIHCKLYLSKQKILTIQLKYVIVMHLSIFLLVHVYVFSLESVPPLPRPFLFFFIIFGYFSIFVCLNLQYIIPMLS
jgi:hypothetical protein